MTRQRALTCRMRLAATATVAVATAVLAAACGSSTPSTSTPSSGTSGSGVVQAQAVVARESRPTTSFPPPGPPINVRSLRGKSVWYIPLSLSVPVFAISNGTLQTALSKVGLTEHSCSAQATPSGTAACINQAVAANAGAIVTDAIPVALASNAFANAESHHIPVLVQDQLPPTGGPGTVRGSGDDKLAYQPLQAANLPEAAADWTIADSHGKANVLLEPYTDSPSTLSYMDSTTALFKKLCPACTLSDQKIGIATASLAASQTSSALLSHPNVNYVLPEYDALDQGVEQGIQQAGFASKVKVATSAGDLPALQAIKAGKISVDAGEDFPYIGWADADEAMRMMLGKPVVKELPPLRLFTAANVGSLSLTPAAQASGSWYGSDEYMSMFEHLWGVK
jgi:ribose transport system substrate-binding protein